MMARLFCIAAICVSGCCPALIQDGPPSIEFTHVPQYGTFDNLRGYVTGADSDEYRVAVYIHVSDWWVKPHYGALTEFDACGFWEVDITTGGVDEQATQIAAFVVPSEYDPAAHDLPSGSDVIASTTVTRGVE